MSLRSSRGVRSQFPLGTGMLLITAAGTPACHSLHPAEATSTSVPSTHSIGDSGVFQMPKGKGSPLHPDCDTRARDLVRQMTLEEKVGQITQAERGSVKPGEVKAYHLGSLLTGGDSAPGDGSAKAWAAMTDAVHREALETRLKIPLLFASDAIHGHNNTVGATIFPHQIGLGAANDPELVERIGRLTAIEMAATGVDWTFAPMIGAARDDRWGRVVESFSEDPRQVGRLGERMILGLQTARLGSNPTSVLATAKHFAGDGNTTYGTSDVRGMDAENPVFVDRGDVRLTNEEFVRLALHQYQPAIDAGVGSVMISLSTFRGQKMLTSKKLLTDVLVGQMGFQGIRMSDYESIRWIPGATLRDKIALAFNSGADMAMEAEKWKEFLTELTAAARSGAIPKERLDDAATRVVRTKCQLGMFDRSGKADPTLLSRVGSAEHRAVAREAVRKSMVLLKNQKGLLPLKLDAAVHVMGVAGHNLRLQCGGWTVSWVGNGEKTTGTHLFQAMRNASKGKVTYSAYGAGADKADVVVVALAEPPYAEWIGDRSDISLTPHDVGLLEQARKSGKPVVALLMSGRPMVITPHIDKADAWIAAWLPGTEGDGMADVLYGRHAPTAKLPFSWPRTTEQEPINLGDAKYDPLFAFGHGLTYLAQDPPRDQQAQR